MTDPRKTEDPRTLVRAALETMRNRQEGLAGTWPRAAAHLGRQALEMALAKRWQGVAPGMENVSLRAQLISLPFFLNSRSARQAGFLWSALSRACHHQAYELPPTADELERWLRDVEELCLAIDAQPNMK